MNAKQMMEEFDAHAALLARGFDQTRSLEARCLDLYKAIIVDAPDKEMAVKIYMAAVESQVRSTRPRPLKPRGFWWCMKAACGLVTDA